MVLKLKDGRKELYQWDVGVVVDVTDENINEVHFSNLRYGVSFNIEVQNGTVTIPPEVLQSGADVYCWAFVRGENGGYTKKEQIFNVEKRPRPADYIYEPTDVLTWEALKQQIEEVDTALMGKVDKSDVLSNIDKNAKPKDIYNAPAINTALAEIEKSTFRVITEPCHIADLEKGVYIIQNSRFGTYNGKVTFVNVTGDKTIDDNYFALDDGLLIVQENIKEIGADGTETSIIGFTAQGSISVPNKSHSGDVQGSPIEIETVESAISVQCYMLQSTKFAESTAPYEANKWYSTMPEAVLSDIGASAIKNEITTESTIYDVPSALAVKNYVNESINVLQGNLDEVSALVGGA